MPLKESLKAILPTQFLKYFRLLRKWRTRFRYRGDQVYCPICESTFRAFAPYGIVPRANARCLRCDSLERHRLIWLYLKERSSLFSTSQQWRVFHSAPERCLFEKFTRFDHWDYIPGDLQATLYPPNMRDHIRAVDLTDLPFPSAHFDFVLCSHVLEHIPEDRRAMQEIFRVLRPGGRAMLQVPVDYRLASTFEDPSITDPAERLQAFGQTDHVRQYGADYRDRLASVGFSVREDTFVREFSKAERLRYGLDGEEIIYWCRKN